MPPRHVVCLLITTSYFLVSCDPSGAKRAPDSRRNTEKCGGSLPELSVEAIAPDAGNTDPHPNVGLRLEPGPPRRRDYSRSRTQASAFDHQSHTRIQEQPASSWGCSSEGAHTRTNELLTEAQPGKACRSTTTSPAGRTALSKTTCSGCAEAGSPEEGNGVYDNRYGRVEKRIFPKGDLRAPRESTSGTKTKAIINYLVGGDYRTSCSAFGAAIDPRPPVRPVGVSQTTDENPK